MSTLPSISADRIQSSYNLSAHYMSFSSILCKEIADKILREAPGLALTKKNWSPYKIKKELVTRSFCEFQKVMEEKYPMCKNDNFFESALKEKHAFFHKEIEGRINEFIKTDTPVEESEDEIEAKDISHFSPIIKANAIATPKCKVELSQYDSAVRKTLDSILNAVRVHKSSEDAISVAAHIVSNANLNNETDLKFHPERLIKIIPHSLK